MDRPKNLEVGDKFVITKDLPWFKYGGRYDGVPKDTIITLCKDDGSRSPQFLFPEGDTWYLDFDNLSPYRPKPVQPKRTIRLIRK